MDVLLTLSSMGQLVIPARLRHLLGLRTGDRLALTLESDGLHLAPQGPAKSSSAHALIGAAHYGGEPVPLERMDPAFYAAKGSR
ncbi:AbrB/MazE/SpoVT family DNA-binding domain-containing protein [Synechococcus sp. CS-1331]|uniref:AbrB/MazE/SpoVT family DNA-binding domain-containing protein n=1 Tax=Synechococcus sp. CS-1331 TaxID=2847973 RepID=UPI00223C50C7|nr:AbrB/MazE/SpoVT family DNA-binding domain-containing protein [Synechococcus sp. CS-1331]MCT0227150.1 AbrB/MazE/SpoVT family DNA-binding domain-containing protein [Synechococcus sp. CS-1331]